jgi:hypothetical protein
LAKTKKVSIEEFQRYGEYKNGRIRFYGINHYLWHGWQFFPDEYTATIVKTWKVMRKLKRIRAKVFIRLGVMNNVHGVILYRRTKRFGDESLINALAATKFISGKATIL